MNLCPLVRFKSKILKTLHSAISAKSVPNLCTKHISLQFNYSKPLLICKLYLVAAVLVWFYSYANWSVLLLLITFFKWGISMWSVLSLHNLRPILYLFTKKNIVDKWGPKTPIRRSCLEIKRYRGHNYRIITPKMHFYWEQMEQFS